MHPNNAHIVIDRSELSQQAVLYTESYNDTHTIFTFKKESVNGDVGDTVLMFVSNKFNVSGVLADKNVVLNSLTAPPLYFVLTFPHKSEAEHFRESLRGCFKQNALTRIPPGLQEFIDTGMSIFQD